MKFIRNALAVGLVAAAASVAACSSQHGATTGSNTNTSGPNVGSTQGTKGNVGKVAMAWQVATGINVTDLHYTITGSGATAGNNYGPLDANIGDAMSAEWVAGGIAAGCGYTLSVSGTDSNNDPCSGTTGTFCVTAGATSYEQISVVCLEPTDGQVTADVTQGSVAVEAGITVVPVAPYTCPGITSFGIVPAELLGTQPGAVSIQTTGTVSAIHWTASGCNNSPGQGPGSGAVGGFTDPTAANTSFNCGSCMGQVTVTAQVDYDQVQPGSDAATNVCAGAPFTTFTGLINCEGGGALTCFSPQIACGGVCVNPLTDNSNCGMCGIPCTGTGVSCVNGACACPTGQTLSGSTCCPNATPNACGAVCVNNATDVNNCGACGNVCPTGDTCVAGTCTIPPPPPSVPCTQLVGGVPQGAGGQTNCVQCFATAAANGVCTGTESLIVQRDIAKSHLTAGQLTTDVTASCYACVAADAFITPAKQCESLAGTVGAGAQAAETKTAACLNTLSCILGVSGGTFNSCGNTDGVTVTDGISNCFCGSNFTNVPACNAAPPISSAGGVNGTCDQVIVDGLGDTSGTSPATVLGQIATATLASGRADAILKAAGTNSSTPPCAICYQ
jgi:hypothetical protein